MADRSEKLEHLFPKDVTSRRPFTAPRPKRDPDKPPAFPRRPDPAAHARALLHDVHTVAEATLALDAERRKALLEGCAGFFVDVTFVPNQDFQLKSLTDERAGIELVTVTEVAPDRAKATLFVSDGKLRVLERKIEAFAPPDSAKKPRHEPLVNSLESIRRSVAQSFWTDPVAPFPSAAGGHWWEVWIRRAVDSSTFRRHAKILGIEVSSRELHFPDRTVLLVRASVQQITRSALLLDSIAELRCPSTLDLEFLALDAADEREVADDLAKRTKRASQDAPSVCLLDTGVDFAHPLLREAFGQSDVHTCFGADVRDCFGAGDWHGTGVAGLALYGHDLAAALLSRDAWTHSHHLESVKYIPSSGQNDPEIYGEITKEAVARAEAANPQRQRVVVTTITADKSVRAEPTSWSAAVDQLCSGYDEEDRVRRLVIVSAGNVVPHNGYEYPTTNHRLEIEDPGQAWNALTVGAHTERATITEPAYSKYSPIASAGDLSPSARTSVTWMKSSSRTAPPPFKPDFVCEGGNWAVERPGAFPTPLDSLTPLSVRRRDGAGTRLLARFGATSGAAAVAAHMAARLQARYPALWPETIRALLIHSCRYTQAMEACFSDVARRRRAELLLRCFGYGVPDLDGACYSARNELTLVVEREIQPFRVDQAEKKGKTNEMHLHRLPWSSELLEQLGEVPVRLRVTLSYFVEPNPGKRGVTGDVRMPILDPARYSSFGLRFDVTMPGEDPEKLVARVNAEEREGPVSGAGDLDEWDLGRSRTKGSVHSDVWRGTAVKLADKYAVAVWPVNGWWRFRPKDPEVCERTARYALVVSIETDAETVDVYTPVMTQIAIER